MGKDVMTAVIAAGVVALITWAIKGQGAEPLRNAVGNAVARLQRRPDSNYTRQPQPGYTFGGRDPTSYVNQSGSPDQIRGTPALTSTYDAQWAATNALAADQEDQDIGSAWRAAEMNAEGWT